MRLNDVALAVAFVALIVAGAFALSTSTARVSATTENQSNLWTSAAIEVDADAPAGLLLEGSNLFPGQAVSGCAEVTYTGSAPGLTLRLHGEGSPGGLAPFVTLTLEVGTGSPGGCADFVPTRAVYQGSLANLLQNHGSNGEGIAVISTVEKNSTVMVRGTATISDDNDAQGLETDFQLVFEVRP